MSDGPHKGAHRDSQAPDPHGEIGRSSSTLLSSQQEDPSFEALLREVASSGAAPVAPPMPERGQVIADKYRIEEKIGQGGMGAVFRATQLVSAKPVAIKWMLRSGSNQQARSRFLREARAAARVAHPNVVDIYDVEEADDGGLYMVMQLLRGESLGQRIARGRLELREAVDLLLPAMRGVEAVHRAGVIHRDLKPDNIFVCASQDGQRARSMVLDFGISAVAAYDESDDTITRDGSVLGTPAYMSPEQLQDSHAVDARTDVYAFGVILYEALTGKRPFSADSHHGLLLAITSKDAPNLRAQRPDLPEAVSQIVKRALAKNRADRYVSVASLIEALAPFGTLDSSVQPPPKPSSRSGRSALIAAAVVGLLLVACAVIWRRSTGDRDAVRALAPVPTRPALVKPPAPQAAPAPAALSAQPDAGEAAKGGDVPTQPEQPSRKRAAKRTPRPERIDAAPASQSAPGPRAGGLLVDEF